MATAKKKRTRNSPPTPKQLKARRKFVRMVRAGAKLARAAKRNSAAGERRHRASSFYVPPTRKSRKPAKKRGVLRRAAGAVRSGLRTQAGVMALSRRRNRKKGVTVRKNGHTLHGAAAQAVLKSRRKHSSSTGKATAGRRRSKNRVTVRRNGHTLHGAAAQAVLNSRKRSTKRSTTKRRGTLLSERKKNRRRVKVGNGIFRSAARRAISRRLHSPIGRRRRNQAPAGVEAIHRAFLGRPTDAVSTMPAPDGTPRDVAVLGELVQLKSETETFDFSPGEAQLAANPRGDLFVLGDCSVESNTDFGRLHELSYVAEKEHLEGKEVEYYHKFGEEGGRPPKLRTDREGMFHIVGGSYSIQPEGITD